MAHCRIALAIGSGKQWLQNNDKEKQVLTSNHGIVMAMGRMSVGHMAYG
jgi:hypothetical protein